ncbi:MAG: division/cell wall cluster transcriptional repressor MraZ [Pseudomonadales bacterium]
MGTNLFHGPSNATMDAKGRFALPSALRKQMPDDVDNSLVITCDPASDCLLVYPPSTWHAVLEDLLSRSNTNQIVKQFQRKFVGNAREVDLDANGRLLIPPVLREYAHLNSKLVLAGMGKNIELWNEQDWAAQNDELKDLMNSGEAAELLDGFSY